MIGILNQKDVESHYLIRKGVMDLSNLQNKELSENELSL